MRKSNAGMVLFMNAALLFSSTALLLMGLWIAFLFLRLEDQEVGTVAWTAFFVVAGFAALLLAGSYRFAIVFHKQGKRIRSMMAAGFPIIVCMFVQWIVAMF